MLENHIISLIYIKKLNKPYNKKIKKYSFLSVIPILISRVTLFATFNTISHILVFALFLHIIFVCGDIVISRILHGFILILTLHGIFSFPASCFLAPLLSSSAVSPVGYNHSQILAF